MGAQTGTRVDSSTVGLVIGPLGFLAILISPVGVQWPTPWLLAVGTLLCVVGLVGLLAGGGRRWLVLAASAAITIGVVVAIVPLLHGMPPVARKTLAVTVWMATWWMTLAIPIPATSLLPLVLFPVLGVLTSSATAANYANDIIFLFLGGFILALGIQRWGLHRRIALHVVHRIGTNPMRTVLGFMMATAFLSMWISNTATTLMMLPIALAVIASMREVAGGVRLGGFAPALLLGIAYSASIGGLATPIGTPPNIAFLRVQEILYPQAPTISFGRWFVCFLPLVLLFLPIAWWLLTRVVHRLERGAVGSGAAVIGDQLRALGAMRPAEKRMAWIFLTTAVLWITRGDLDLGAIHLPGWAGLVERGLGLEDFSSHLHDATIAMAMALLMFVLPGDRGDSGEPCRLMQWETARRLPWGILLLFGGGFALAQAFKDSGLSQFMGEAFAGRVQHLHPILLVASVCVLLTFLTEVTSNTATTQVMLPVLAGAAGAMGVNPLLLMIPATLSASCAFMLPIATPPNAIVFGSSEIEMRQMIRAGLLLNLVGVVLVTLVFYFLTAPLLGLDLSTVPVWAVGR